MDALLQAEADALAERAAARAAAAAPPPPPTGPPPPAVTTQPGRPSTRPTVEAAHVDVATDAAGATAAAPHAPDNPLSELGTLPGPPPHPDRYVVLEVTPCDDGYDLRLLADPPPDGKAGSAVPPPPLPPLYLRVRGPWADTAPTPGDVVAVADASPDAPGPSGERGARVDGFAHAPSVSLPSLLLAPDRLLSGTRVAGGLTCPRAAVLEERFGGDPGPAATAGTLAHEVLGAALADPATTGAAADAAVARSAARLVEVGLTEAAARTAVAAAAAPIASFAAAYTSRGHPTAPVEDASDASATACLTAVIDIEETVWAPRAGIKGVLDATVAARFGSRASDASDAPSDAPPAHLVPLELKTGRRHDSHRAQVSLYGALLAARYGTPPHAGLLLYTDGRPPSLVPARTGELASLLARRNALAAALAPGAPLPPLLDGGARRPCRSCFQRVACGVATAIGRGGRLCRQAGPTLGRHCRPFVPRCRGLGGRLAGFAGRGRRGRNVPPRGSLDPVWARTRGARASRGWPHPAQRG